MLSLLPQERLCLIMSGKKLIDMTGERFGRTTVIKFTYRIAKSVLHTDFETVRERIMRCDPDLLPDKWKKKVLEYHAK